MESFWSFRFKEMGTNKAIQNLSSNHFLVEASGDSDQLDFHHNSNFDHPDPFASSASAADDDDDDDEDDAESCSCDVSDYYSCVSNYHQSETFEAQEESSVHVNGKKLEEDGGEEEEVEQKIHERWEGSTGNFKSCVSVESTNEPINEMEKNRLFWETCLAS